MTKELSPSEYRKMVAAGSVKQTNSQRFRLPVIGALIVIGLCGISFAAGESVQKHHLNNNHSASRAGAGNLGFSGGQRRYGAGLRPRIGQVTAVSAESITINNSRTGADQIFKIAPTTTVDNNGATASTADIKVGDSVVVVVSSGDVTTAATIRLNPTMMPTQNSLTPTSNPPTQAL